MDGLSRHLACALVMLGFVASAPALAQTQPPAVQSEAPATRTQPIAEELRALEQQRAGIRLEWGATLTVIGGTALLLAPLIHTMSNLCAIGESDNACDRRESVQSTAVVIGIGGLVVASVGVVWWMYSAGERRKLSTRIDELRRRRRATLAWNAYADRDRLSARLELRW
jgi:hypothetical protein